MATRRRPDRHGRGMRGPLARPLGPEMGAHAGRIAEVVQAPSKSEFFAGCVTESVERISRHNPQSLHQVTFGIEDVPSVRTDWTGEQVPLATAMEATDDAFAQVVVYRRPLEHRARSRTGLRILVHRTIVEQLAALTGLEVSTIDPDAEVDEPDP